MPDYVKLDELDRAALQKLDPNFVVGNDGMSAAISGLMTVEVVRAADDRIRMRIMFPNDRPFDVLCVRAIGYANSTSKRANSHDRRRPIGAGQASEARYRVTQSSPDRGGTERACRIKTSLVGVETSNIQHAGR